MRSLKAFTPILSKALLVAPAALYERQRILRLQGIIESGVGHGPGSGVPLKAETVAALLVSLMASDVVHDTGNVTPRFLELTPEKGECSLTGATNLCEALARRMAGQAKHPTGTLIVERSAYRATLMDDRNHRGTNFLTRDRFRPIRGLHTTVSLPKEVLRLISREFQKETKVV